MTIALGAIIAVLAVLLVALPFLREPNTGDDRIDAPTDADLRVAALLEERDRALAALKDLEFDHRTGKITDDDYRSLVPQLRQSAAAALKSLERYGPVMSVPEPSPPPDEGTLPYPPPDEGTPPSVPPPDEGED